MTRSSDHHCQGCVCDMFKQDIMLAKISAQLVHELSNPEWTTKPVLLRINPEQVKRPDFPSTFLELDCQRVVDAEAE